MIIIPKEIEKRAKYLDFAKELKNTEHECVSDNKFNTCACTG